MATLNFRDARIYVDGYELSGDFNSIGATVKAEILDETSFGDTTRIHKGGLVVTDVAGDGNWDAAAGRIESIAFSLVGVDDKVISVFANGITEGTATDKGFSMKGVVDEYTIGGNVGALLPFKFAIKGRGIEA